jgi:hypothetical protein
MMSNAPPLAPLANHVNPDHFLDPHAGAVDSPERGKAAWQRA